MTENTILQNTIPETQTKLDHGVSTAPSLDATASDSQGKVNAQKELAELLNEEHRNVKSMQNFKTVDDLAKSYLNLNGLLGKKVGEWSKENVDAFLTKQGRPEAPDKYTLPDELAHADKFKEHAFKAGLTQEQVKILADEAILYERSVQEKANKEKELKKQKFEAELREAFGTSYDNRKATADRAIYEAGGETLLNAVRNTDLGLNADLIIKMASVGKNYFESDKIVKADSASYFGTTPQEAQNKINQNLANPDFRDQYYNRSHPLHQQAVNEMQEYFNKIGPKNITRQG